MRIKYLLILGILTAFGPICIDFYLPALPQIAKDLNTSTTLSQLTLTASLLGLGIGQLFFGPWSDRVGRKKPLIFALFLFSLSSLACTLIQNIEQMIIIRFIQGFAGAGGAVLARAIAKDLYSGNQLAHFFALMMAINGVAPILAPVLGSFQLIMTNWRGLFVSLTILGCIVLIICIKALNESRISSSVSTSLISGFKAIFKDKIFLKLCITQSLVMGGLFAYIGSSSFVFQEIYKFSAQQFSLLFAINGFGLIIASLITSKLLKFFTTTQLLYTTLILAVIISLFLIVSSLVNTSLTVCLVALFISLSLVSSISTLSTTLAMERNNKFSGTASAFLGFLMFSVGGLTPLLTTSLGMSLYSMSIVIFTCYLISLLVYLSIIKQLKFKIISNK
ncbi:multidrug effflux MFS transporter [Acinetobacter baumannii]|nr:multidrug effflux MFS transporter [Acinetobacter baumannii]MDO7400112.1 multidrug effflux MFS transporter [Acinetobacter baumannii]